VVGFTTVSRGKVPGKTCEKRRNNNNDDNNNINSNYVYLRNSWSVKQRKRGKIYFGLSVWVPV
jgi:hypothetical protein